MNPLRLQRDTNVPRSTVVEDAVKVASIGWNVDSKVSPKVAIRGREVKAVRTMLNVARLVLFADASWAVLPIRWRLSLEL